MIETENDFFLKLLILTLTALALSFIVYEMTVKRLILKRRLKIAGVAAILLTLFTFFYLQGHSFLFNQEGILSGKIGHVKKWWAHQFGEGSNESDSYADLLGSVIFINTSQAPKLYPIPKSMQGEKAQMAMTDRGKLDTLFKNLSTKKDIDLVACDVIFSEWTPLDKQLVADLAPIQARKKLVLAWYDKALEDNNEFYKSIDANSFGDVAAQKDEPVYYSHRVLDPVNHHLSFPYQMHARLRGTKIDKDISGRYFANQFVTELRLTDEPAIYTSSSKWVSQQRDTNKNNTVNRLVEEHYFTLGQALTPYGNDDIDSAISLIKARRQKVIVFIGNFTDDYADVYQTSYGPMHGSTIILNEFLHIDKGQNTMSYARFMLYMCFIFVSFFGIISLLLYKADLRDMRREQRHTQRKKKEAPLSTVLDWLETVLTFIADEAFYLLLFIMALIADLGFQTIINIVGLIYLIPLMSVLLKFYINLHNKNELIGHPKPLSHGK